MSVRSRYASVLRAPHVGAALTSSILARMPIGIESLAIVLFLRDQGSSYAVAGLVSGAMALGGAIGAPIGGRLVDSLGQRRVLLPMALAHAAALAALLSLGAAGASALVLVLLALLGGATTPPISSVMRSLWPVLLRDRAEDLQAAFALDSVFIEIIFVAGPLLTALAVVLVSPAAAVVLALVLALGGTATFVSLPPNRELRPSSTGERHPLGALASPGIRTLIAVMLPLGFCFGATEVTFPAFSEAEASSRDLAAVLLALWSLGSALGGLAYGAVGQTGPLPARFARLAALLPIGFLPLAAAPGFAAMLVLAVIAGLGMAPLMAAGNQLIGDVAPPNAVTEAYTWPLTAMISGAAAGIAAAGGIVEAADWRAAFAVATAVGAVGAVIAFARRGTLTGVRPPA
jgi:MFS family permease